MADLDVKLPDALTPELREILGFQCFQLGQFAHVYQAAGKFVDSDGKPLRKRAEDEQAFMLHRFLVHWHKAGAGWRVSIAEEFDEIATLAEARPGESEADTVERLLAAARAK